MTDGQVVGLVFLILGLIFAIFAKPIGRLKQKTDPILGERVGVEWYQMINFIGGLFFAFLGLLLLLGVF